MVCCSGSRILSILPARKFRLIKQIKYWIRKQPDQQKNTDYYMTLILSSSKME